MVFTHMLCVKNGFNYTIVHLYGVFTHPLPMRRVIGTKVEGYWPPHINIWVCFLYRRCDRWVP